MDVGSRIRELRELTGTSAKELSIALRVSPSFISGLENGTKKCSLDNLEKICAAMNLSLNDFFAPQAQDLPKHILELINSAQKLAPDQVEAINLMIKTLNRTSAGIDNVVDFPAASEDKISRMQYGHQRLKALRLERGLSPEELCAEIKGLTPKLLEKYETGREPLHPNHQGRFGDFFDVSVFFLLGMSSERKGSTGSQPNFEAMSQADRRDVPLSKEEKEALDMIKKDMGIHIEDEDADV